MTYELFIGDYAYSSWSLRGWLLFHRFGIRVTTHLVDFSAGTVAEQLGPLAPARTVPALRLPEGAVAADSLAIAEELATRHPDAGLWPADPSARAIARGVGPRSSARAEVEASSTASWPEASSRERSRSASERPR